MMNMTRFQKQRGSTLMVVMLIVMLVMIIGAVVIRQGLVSLNIATSSQAKNLMVQSSDTAVYKVENPASLIKETLPTGMFGYLRNSTGKGKELVFCYNGKDSDFFKISKASVVYWPDGGSKPENELGISGFCKASQGMFSSARNAVMTQVSVSFPASTTEETTPFSGFQVGTDGESSKTIDPERVVVHAVSLIPSWGGRASAGEIEACLSEHMHTPPSDKLSDKGSGRTVSKCLTDLGVPFVTHVSEYYLSQNVTK